MLWRMAFSALMALFGGLVGVRLGLGLAQGDIDALRNQAQIAAQQTAAAEAQWQAERAALQASSTAAQAALAQALEDLGAQRTAYGASESSVADLRHRLSTCHSHLTLALSGHERLRTKLDKIDKNCSTRSQ